MLTKRFTYFLLWLTIFFLPFYLFRFKICGIPTNILEVLAAVLFVSWCVFDRKTIFKQTKGCYFAILLILAGVLCSALFSADIRAGLGILKGWFVIPLIIWFIVVKTINKKEQLRVLLDPLFWSGLGVSLIALFYWFSGNLTYDGRLRAFYLSPNYLAMYLSPILILALGLHFFIREKYNRALLLTAQCLILVTICLTKSYGACLAVVCALLFILWRWLRNKKNAYILCLLLIVSVFFLSQVHQSKFQNLLNLSFPSLESRLMIWRSAWQIIQDHFFVGIGPGMFQEYYLDYQKYFPPYMEWAVPQPHNILLAFWLQTGLIGLTGFIWLIVRFFKNGFKKTTACQYIFDVVLAAMVCILIHGLFDTTYWKNDLSVLFWLVIGIGCIKGRLSD